MRIKRRDNENKITKNAFLITINIQIPLQTSKEGVNVMSHSLCFSPVQALPGMSTGKASPVLELHRQCKLLALGHLCQPGKDQTRAWCFHICTTRGQQVATNPRFATRWQMRDPHLLCCLAGKSSCGIN